METYITVIQGHFVEVTIDLILRNFLDSELVKPNIDEFPTVISPNENCAICLDEMAVSVKLPCSHLFCKKCLQEWLDRANTCPNCRSEIKREETPIHKKSEDD